MINRLVAMVGGRRRDSGDILFATLAVMIAVAFFVLFMMSTAWAIMAWSKHNQRNTLAQEAVDVAIAQAMFTLNEEYGVITDEGPYGTEHGAYSRTLPGEDSPVNADMDSFNASKRTTFHDVDNSGGEPRYGIQAEARWWVDVFDVGYGSGASFDQNRVRSAGQVGDLVAEARVVSADGEITYGYRSVRMPLHQIQARAVKSDSEGAGLSYIVSPLSLFQFGVFGTNEVADRSPHGYVEGQSPLATSGHAVLSHPSSTFDVSSAHQRRFDSNIFLFGSGNCLDYDPSTGTTSTCEDTRTLNTGFEVEPDQQLVNEMAEYCTSQEQGLEDFITSEQETPSLTAGDTTYCFRDFVMDQDVHVVAAGTGRQVVRMFVSRTVDISDGARFVSAAGTPLGDAPASEPQVGIFTTTDEVTLRGQDTSSTAPRPAKFYLYAPNAVCSPGENASGQRRNAVYLGALVCETVRLDEAAGYEGHVPFPELVAFGEAGFGTDLYPNNLWYVNRESTEHVARTDEGW